MSSWLDPNEGWEITRPLVKNRESHYIEHFVVAAYFAPGCDVPVGLLADDLTVSPMPLLIVTNDVSKFVVWAVDNGHKVNGLTVFIQDLVFKDGTIVRPASNDDDDDARIISFPTSIRSNVFDKRTKRYTHAVISPLDFAERLPDDITDEEMNTLGFLLEFGEAVNELSRELDCRVKGSAGGYGAELIRKPEFFGNVPRRRIPLTLNELVRPFLPGNHYYVNEEIAGKNLPIVLEYDMSSAHDYAVLASDFPSSDGVESNGDPFSEDVIFPVGSPGFDSIIKEHGLFRLMITVTKGTKGPGLPQLKRKCEREVFTFYSNELPLLFKSPHAKVLGIVAHCTSHDTENEGLHSYARWALKRKEANGKNRYKGMVKTALLSTYGYLAKTNHHTERWTTHLERGSKAERGNICLADGSLVDVWISTPKGNYQPDTTNVLHRGMIEAATRTFLLRAVEAGWGKDKRKVAHLYGDAVFALTPPRELLPNEVPWKGTSHTAMTFFNPVQYKSDQACKNPGGGVPPWKRDQAGTTEEAATVRDL